MDAIEIRKVLGSRACWNRVGYRGRTFAPALGTYRGVEPLRFFSTTDSGRVGNVANLLPLMGAAMYEAGFAFECGPLSTWSN